jgi:hypothetical protein
MEESVILQVQESFRALGNILPVTDELFPELLSRYINHRECVTISGEDFIVDLEIPREILVYYMNHEVTYPKLEYLLEYPSRGKTRLLKTPRGTKIRIIQFPTFVRTILKTTAKIRITRVKVVMDIDVFSTRYRIMRHRLPKKQPNRLCIIVKELYGEDCTSGPLFSKNWGDLVIDTWRNSREVYNPSTKHGAFIVHTWDLIDPILTKDLATDFISKTQLGKIFGEV